MSTEILNESSTTMRKMFIDVQNYCWERTEIPLQQLFSKSLLILSIMKKLTERISNNCYSQKVSTKVLIIGRNSYTYFVGGTILTTDRWSLVFYSHYYFRRTKVFILHLLFYHTKSKLYYTVIFPFLPIQKDPNNPYQRLFFSIDWCKPKDKHTN